MEANVAVGGGGTLHPSTGPGAARAVPLFQPRPAGPAERSAAAVGDRHPVVGLLPRPDPGVPAARRRARSVLGLLVYGRRRLSSRRIAGSRPAPPGMAGRPPRQRPDGRVVARHRARRRATRSRSSSAWWGLRMVVQRRWRLAAFVLLALAVESADLPRDDARRPPRSGPRSPPRPPPRERELPVRAHGGFDRRLRRPGAAAHLPDRGPRRADRALVGGASRSRSSSPSRGCTAACTTRSTSPLALRSASRRSRVAVAAGRRRGDRRRARAPGGTHEQRRGHRPCGQDARRRPAGAPPHARAARRRRPALGARCRRAARRRSRCSGARGGRRPGLRLGRRRHGAALHRRRSPGSEATLAIVPAGTANLLATNLGIPKDLDGRVAIGLHGARADRRRPLNGERFAVMAGAGFDARMIRDADGGLKDRLGRARLRLDRRENLARRAVRGEDPGRRQPLVRGQGELHPGRQRRQAVRGRRRFDDAEPGRRPARRSASSPPTASLSGRGRWRATRSADRERSPFVQVTRGARGSR